VVGRSGAPRRVLWTNTLVHGGGGQIAGAAIVGVDITERLELQTAQLEREKLESLGRLAASVAHDFNNLLTVIGTSMDIIAETCRPEELTILEDTRSAVEQATQLTSSLLTYARREKATPTRLDPDDLIRRILPMLVSLVGSKATLSHELGASNARLVMDPTQFRQVLLNLVGNAAEAVRGTGSHIRITTRLAALEEAEARAHGLTTAGGFFVLSVADDGGGIAGNVLPRIFDPFFTTKEDGTGLGLATCEAVVRRAGGFITVKSALLEGTTFDVYVPATEHAVS
jgi:two-component system, cell cycle sensor histidine kinase and response regulator CckA